MLIYGVMMKMNNDILSNFIEKDNQWLSDTIEKYPEKIPVEHLAEHFGCTAASVRSAIVQNQTFGLFWREGSKSRNTFLIPTGLFVRWYCKASF